MATPLKSEIQESREMQDVDYSEYVPKNVDSEDVMPKREVKQCWERIYRAVGLTAGNEKERLDVRAAVYVYGCKNGTTRSGAYQGECTTAKGREFDAAVIPKCTGIYNIRRFFRGNDKESYRYLKTSGAITPAREPAFIKKKEREGVPAELAWATADWLTYCIEMTPKEMEAHETSRLHGLEKARRARGGHSLEHVEKEVRDRSLHVQGTLNAADGEVDF